MHLLILIAILSAALRCCQSLNIIVGNDDGFATANVRELYRLLKKDGHDVYLVAPVTDQSGQGGRSVFTDRSTLNAPSQADIIPAGAPSFGTDPHDSHVWYYNGTPVACTLFALDYVIPMHTKWQKVDLLVAGPNYGANLGPMEFTWSGTLGAAYSAIERGVPAISFSADNDKKQSYLDLDSSNATKALSSATIAAQLSIRLVRQLASRSKGAALLPPGYGLNVNYPQISNGTNKTCIDPPFIHSRLTGGAQVAGAVYKNETKTFTFGIVESVGSNTCINGDCSLPGATEVFYAGCYTSVSVFTVDYDAPNCRGSKDVKPLLQPLVQSRQPGKGASGDVKQTTTKAGQGDQAKEKAEEKKDLDVTEPIKIPGDKTCRTNSSRILYS